MKQKTLFISTLTALSMVLGFGVAFSSNSKSEIKEVDAASHPANFDPYYYSGNYYSGISGTGESLKGQLTKLIFPKGWYSYSGSGSGAIAQILQSADEDPTNPSNMIYFYTRDSVKKNAASSWNREHVWPKALSNNCWGEKNYKSYQLNT